MAEMQGGLRTPRFPAEFAEVWRQCFRWAFVLTCSPFVFFSERVLRSVPRVLPAPQATPTAMLRRRRREELGFAPPGLNTGKLHGRGENPRETLIWDTPGPTWGFLLYPHEFELRPRVGGIQIGSEEIQI